MRLLRRGSILPLDLADRQVDATASLQGRISIYRALAERVGFEPTRACTLPLFESGTFDHSDISPPRSIAYLPGYDKPPSSFGSSNNRGLDAAAQLHCAAASSP